jgi:hypothetical protein
LKQISAVLENLVSWGFCEFQQAGRTDGVVEM